MTLLNALSINPAMLAWLIPLIIWDAVWKGIGMWKAGRNNQLAWFICILIFNTVGILPIIYLGFFQKGSSTKKNSSSPKKRRR
jgi:hypothetical protein